MCEYCGCQAVAAIAELTREHDELVNLIGCARRAQAAGDVAGLAAVGRRMTRVLAPHTRVEEQGLFVALAAQFPDHVAALTAEHRHIEAVLAECAHGAPTDPTWPARLLEALRVLRDHILAEQDGVFPAALANLDPEDWDAIDAVRSGATAELSPRERASATGTNRSARP
ncbi:hemerythrin HHE cation-binding protein [Mycobacterium sp. E342]|nr:hemerythrin HHE cation-binding protein [Mycobacterium sp. E342]